MTTDTDVDYLDSWWSRKLSEDYSVQEKHLAAAHLLTKKHFPLVELGAGPGVFLKLVEQRFPAATLEGVDISDTAITNKVCVSPVSKGEILQWKPRGQIETVALIDVIEHMLDPEPLLHRIADVSAYVLVALPNFNFLQARWDVLRGRIPFQNRVARGGHVYWCQYQTLLTLFASTGLSVEAENHLFPRNKVRSLRSMFQHWPSLFAHEFVFLLKTKRSGNDYP